MAFTSREERIQVVSYHRMRRAESYLSWFKHSAFSSYKDTITKVLTIFSCFALLWTKTQFYKVSSSYLWSQIHFFLCVYQWNLYSHKSPQKSKSFQKKESLVIFTIMKLRRRWIYQFVLKRAKFPFLWKYWCLRGTNNLLQHFFLRLWL